MNNSFPTRTAHPSATPPLPTPRLRRMGGTALLLAALAGSAQAAPLTWDADNATAGIQDGSGGGTWGVGVGNWRDTGSATDNVNWANGTVATFGGGSAGAGGTVNINAGGVSATGLVFNAPFAGGNYTIGGPGTLTLSGTPTITANANATIGSALSVAGTLGKAGTGTLTLAGGAGLARFDINAGGVSVTGGTYTTSSYLTMAGTSTYTQTGGSVTVGSGFGFYVGNAGLSTTVATISGGSLATPNEYIRLGTSNSSGSGTSTLNISNTGTVTGLGVSGQNTGASTTSTVNLGDGLNFTGGANIAAGGTSGLLSVNLVNKSAGALNFNFNGGTLRALASNAAFVNGLTSVNVQDAGGVVDNNGFAVGITNGLLHGGVAATDGGMIFKGSGTTTLSGAGTYNGGTTVSSGTLVHANNTATGSATTGAITLGDANSGAANIELRFTAAVQNSSVATAYKAITVTNQGSGTRTLTFNQGSSFVNASLDISKAVTLQTTGAGAQYGMMGQITGSGAGAGNDSVIFSNSSASPFYYVAGYSGSGVLANTFAGNVRFTGTGTTVTQNLTYINAGAGYQNGAITDTASVTVDAGATWQINWGNESIDGLNGAGNMSWAGNGSAPTLTVGAAGGNGAFSGVMSSAIGLTKTGAGTQILSGASPNTYTGATTVSGGTLLVNKTHNAGTGTYTVNSGGKLGGNGTITTSGAVTITGQITGGDFGTVDTLRIAGAGSRTLSGTYLFDVDYSGMSGDLISITGATSLDLTGGTFAINELNAGNMPAAGQHYAIKIFESNVANGGAAPTFTLSTQGLARGQSVVTWDGGKTYYLVPEPASFALLALGSLLLLRRPSRRRGPGQPA